MGKKIKLTVWELQNYLHSINKGPYNIYRKELTDKSGKKVRGTVYILSGVLTNEQKTYLDSFPNVTLLMSRSQYAPELVHGAVWVGDMCLPSKKQKIINK